MTRGEQSSISVSRRANLYASGGSKHTRLRQSELACPPHFELFSSAWIATVPTRCLLTQYMSCSTWL